MVEKCNLAKQAWSERKDPHCVKDEHSAEKIQKKNHHMIYAEENCNCWFVSQNQYSGLNITAMCCC